MPARQYSPAQTAEALARVATGESLNSVSKSMGIPRSTVRLWRDNINPSAMAAPEETLGFMNEVMGLAHDYVVTLRSILRETQSPNWIKQQSGTDLARYFDSTFGQLASLGAAIERGQDLARANEQAGRQLTSGASLADIKGPLEADAASPAP